MLEKKSYSIVEMESMLGSVGKQNIDRKLQRYDIDFTSEGYGQNRIYTIKHIPDPFKVYAITKLGIPAQADFTKIRNLYYLFFCGEDFTDSPLIEMERIMEEEGVPMARQTITKWINYLEHIDYIAFNNIDCKYYAIKKDSLSNQKSYEEIDAETYKKGWAIYHSSKEEIGASKAYTLMYNIVGGHPYKKPAVMQNAVYEQEIGELIDVINESFIENPM